MKKRSGDDSRLEGISEILMQAPPLGTPLDWENPLNDGCVMHLAMNEGHGDKVQDLSLNGNHGTLHNFAFPPTAASGWNPGQTGVGLNFDGTDDYINCGTAAAVTKEATVSAIVLSKEIGAASGWKGINVKECSYHLRFSNRRPVFGIKDEGATKQTNVLVGDELDTDVWYNIVGTYDGQKLKIYVDGNEVTAVQTAYAGDIDTNANPLLIGVYREGDLSNIHNCSIDQPRVYNRALTAKEVRDYATNPWQVYLQP